MKILIVVYSITPGSGLSKYILSLSKILNVDGNQLSVVTTHATDEDYERRELEKVGVIEYYSLLKYVKYAKYFQTIKVLRKINPDIIINNYNAIGQYVLTFLPNKYKNIHILHNNTTDFYRVGGINGARTAGWIAPTPAVAQRFNEYTKGKFIERVFVFPHGVEKGTPHQKHGNKIKELSFAGVLYEHKGVRILPAIIKSLKQRGLNFHFNIIGQGILGDWLKEELKDEVVDGLVKFTGVISHEEVYEYFSKSDIFVYPTHIDSFGLVIAEAMMNGAVPVVSLLEGITDSLITDGKNGYLPKIDDVDTFCNRIEELISDDDKLKQFRSETIKKAEESFSFGVMQKNYLNYLKSL